MAYPTIDRPYGLEPINLKGGIPFAGSTRMIPIGQGYGTPIFNGDVVGLSNGNSIITPYNADTSSGAVAGDILGVFLGCEYSTGAGPIFGKVRQQYYPASTNAPDAVAYVLDDPNALFKAAVIAQPQNATANSQLNTGTTIGYMSPSFVGSNAFLIAGNGGSTATGNSLAGVSGGNPTVASSVAGNIRQTVGTGSGTAPCLRVIQMVPDTAVTVATALTSSPTAGTTFTVTSTAGIVPGMQCVIAGISGNNAGSPGSNLTVTSVVTNSNITVSTSVTATSGTSVSFIGYPEVIVGWNFGYHSYLLAAGV